MDQPSRVGAAAGPDMRPDPVALSGVRSARELAEALGVNERTIRRAIKQGLLVAPKVGGSYRITQAALDRYLAGRDRDLAPPPRPLPTRRSLHSLPGTAIRLSPLPTMNTSLIGREHDIAEVAALLRDASVRLLTLTGPGGCGKTRLALATAAVAGEVFAGGVAFVALAPVRDPDLVLDAIAHTLGVRDVPVQPIAERLQVVLGDRDLLLVLDNLEHLVAAAPALGNLLTACPGLKILATSRAALHLSGEHNVRVPPLALPTDTSFAAISRSAAVRLFTARAQAVVPAFALTESNAAGVAEICRRLDGLPLAIELAAARVNILQTAELLGRLAHPLGLLTRGPVDAPARLQTMRDAIAWSYGLLTPPEQALFRRLAVFVGGWSLDAAEVMGRSVEQASQRAIDGRLADSSALDLLASLVDSSLVRTMVGRSGEQRFEMLETIREFGLEQLAARGEEATVRGMHAAYFLALTERYQLGTQPPDPRNISHAFTDDLGNVRAALAWFLERGLAEAGLRLAPALHGSRMNERGLREQRTWLERLLQIADSRVAPAVRAWALLVATSHAHWMGDYESETRASIEEALAIYQAENNLHGIASALRTLGNLELGLEEYQRAERVLLDAEALARRHEIRGELSAALNLLGLVDRANGEYERALAHHQEAHDVARAAGDVVAATVALVGVAFAALGQRDLPTARTACRAAIEADSVHEDLFITVRCLILGGGIAVLGDQLRDGVRLLSRAVALEAERGTHWPPVIRAECDHWLATARDELGEAVFTAVWAEGIDLPLDQAIDQTLALLASRSTPFVTTDRTARLTHRELDVLRLVAAGHTDREIADTLFISRPTASKHVQAILAKLGVDSRTAAAATALRERLI